ncbi:MAG: DUF1800 family protein, partial [Chloroflexi bacterium]|nr:DUF1800 family protein [Chloroflexota bacterium]
QFLATKLYNFFVSDYPAPEEAIETLSAAYFDSNYDLREVMRVLLSSDFFKNARFAKVKSPAELVAGVLRLVKDFQEPKPGLVETGWESKYMGQELLNPPTVEGWHTGKEWIDSGTLVERINFTADQVGNINHSGVKDIISRIGGAGTVITAEQLVDGCLENLGSYKLADETRNQLLELAASDGEIRSDSDGFPRQVATMLQSIVATTEYLFA